MQALAEVEAPPEVPHLRPAGGWMSCLPWLRFRRRQLLDALRREATHLGGNHGLHVARIDALGMFDRRIAELGG